jgi:hypothetical protein
MPQFTKMNADETVSVSSIFGVNARRSSMRPCRAPPLIRKIAIIAAGMLQRMRWPSTSAGPANATSFK